MFSMTDEDWRRKNKSINSKMKVILRQQMFTDTVFTVCGQEFKCHKLILAVGSPYFERMFYHTFRNAGSHPAVISDVTPEAFQTVLNFLYTNVVTFGSEIQAFQTYEAAEKFQMPDLKSECEIYLSELDFRPCTIWNNLERATYLEMKRMQRKYLGFIQNNSRQCLNDDAFLKTSGDVVMQIMQIDRLSVAEVDLADRLVAWAETKNPRYLKVITEPYLRHVRFRAMTKEEFCRFIKVHPNVINAEDSLAILHDLEVPSLNSLPGWCSRLPRRQFIPI